jgi:hypothetical protein
MINGEMSPFTNEDILKLLLPYDAYPNERSLFWISPDGRVNFKKHSKESPLPPIDILTQQGESKFRALISNGYEVAQNREVLKASLSNQNGTIFKN